MFHEELESRHPEQIPNSCPDFLWRSGDPSRIVTLVKETASAEPTLCMEHRQKYPSPVTGKVSLVVREITTEDDNHAVTREN